MLGCIPGLSGAEDIAYSLLILAVSVFCLTSLDTATRLGRYMFQELFIPAGKTREELSGWRKFFSNPVVATLITVTLGVALGLTGYQLVWPLFGAANQLGSPRLACWPCAHGSAMPAATTRCSMFPWCSCSS